MTRPQDDIAELEQLIQQVRALADRSQSAALRQAARLLAGERRGGRPAIDDMASLETVARLMAEGRGPWAACMIAARGVAIDGDGVRSIAKRLLRKFEKSPRKGFCE